MAKNSATLWSLSLLTALSYTYGAEINEPALEATSLVKKVAYYVDREIIDPLIITTCASLGAAAGTYIITEATKYVIENRNFTSAQKLEVSFGTLFGTAVGFQIGKHIVKSRHTITDPLFKYGYTLIVRSLRYRQQESLEIMNPEEIVL